MNDEARSYLEEARGMLGHCLELKRKLGAALAGSSPAAGWGGSAPPAGGAGADAESTDLMRQLSQAVAEAADALNRVISTAVGKAGDRRSSMPTMMVTPRPPSGAGVEARPGSQSGPGGAGRKRPGVPSAGGTSATLQISEAEDVLDLSRSFVGIRETIEREKLVIDRRDYGFVAKAPSLIQSLGEAERNGEPGARILVDCVRFMDHIERDYIPGVSPTLSGTMRSLRSRIAAVLEKNLDLKFVPDPRNDPPFRGGQGAGWSGALSRLPNAKRTGHPSSRPEGEALALRKRGVTRGARSEPPEVIVSVGRTSEAFDLVDRVARSLLKPVEQTAERRQAKASAFRDIKRKYLPVLANNLQSGGHDRSEGGGHVASADDATVVRYVANALQPLVSGRLGAPPQARAERDAAVASAIGALVEFLGGHGIKPIPVRLGVAFDDSFSTTKFDRRLVPSGERPGQVVDVLQMGFVNRDGVPVQKVIVGVSGGVSGG